MVSKDCARCAPRCQLPRPSEERYPANPHSAAGARMDPPVSVPSAATAEPSSTLAAAPEDEPPVSALSLPG